MMTLAQFALIMVLSTAVIWMTLAWWAKPHIAAIMKDRDQWKARCQTAELMLEQTDSSSVRLIDPGDPGLDIFLKGTHNDEA